MSVEVDALKSAGVSGRKVSYIMDLAFVFDRDGITSAAPFTHMTDNEVVQQLTAIKGIGVWTAQMFLIFYLRRLDAFPSGDLGVRKGLAAAVKKSSLTPEQCDEIASSWAPYRSVAAWYMWQSLENFTKKKG